MNIEGIYETESGAVYKLTKETDSYILLYWEPNARQIKSGIKKGDTAFKGNMLSNILSGIFFQYYSLKIKELCPSQWENPTHINLTVSDDGKTIVGNLLEERIQDDCKKDARRITELIFTKKQ